MTFKRNNMATSNRNKISSTLFDARVGDCYISMCLDKRHPEIVKDFSFPLCMKFHISGSRYYYSLGEKCTEDEMIRPNNHPLYLALHHRRKSEVQSFVAECWRYKQRQHSRVTEYCKQNVHHAKQAGSLRKDGCVLGRRY